MAQRLVVVDGSALIGLAAAGQFHLLRKLFGAIIVTSAVRDEVLAAPSLPGSSEVEQAHADGWLTTADAHDTNEAFSALGPGEASVIALALEQDGPCLVVLDDAATRIRAEDEGLAVVGVLGILVAAKRSGYLDMVGPALERLTRLGFHVYPGLTRTTLGDVGEA